MIVERAWSLDSFLHRVCCQLPDITLQFRRTVGGSVGRENPAAGALCDLQSVRLIRVAENFQDLIRILRNKDFGADRKEVFEPVPVVANDGDAAGGGFEEADAGGMAD